VKAQHLTERELRAEIQRLETMADQGEMTVIEAGQLIKLREELDIIKEARGTKDRFGKETRWGSSRSSFPDPRRIEIR
jgi:hypothetical protein